MIESSHELIHVMLFQEQLIKCHFIQANQLPCGTLIRENTYKHMFSNYRKKNSLPLFVKSAAECGRNLSSNWRWHKKRWVRLALTVSNLMNQTGKRVWQSAVSSMGGEIIGCRRVQFSVVRVCLLDVKSSQFILLNINSQVSVLKDYWMWQVLFPAKLQHTLFEPCRNQHYKAKMQ